LKILFTGDVHIGRRSSRLPGHLAGHSHSCASAWHRFVDAALLHQVDVVAVSGDLVDQSNRYLEAVGPLEKGLRRLSDAGVETVMVAGNHDHDVLPSLINSMGSPSTRLLGRHGEWERCTLERRGVRVHLDGWSFPQALHRESPVQSYEPSRDGAPILVLLHADLDQPNSRYAPIVLPDLRRHPQVLFLLGHVHEPRAVEEPGGARYIYAGSPQAMDPGEPGKHGAWLITLSGLEAEARLIPMSTVRYETVEVSVDAIERPEDIDSRVFRGVRDHFVPLAEESPDLRCVRYKVRLIGSTSLLCAVEDRLQAISADLELSAGSAVASIDSVEPRMTPAHDLDALATGLGAPAIVADILRRNEVDAGLLAELRRVAAEIYGSRAFVEVSGGDEDVAAMVHAAEAELSRAAAILLDELLLQKAEPR
jgi:exonuclease SbcD